MKILTFVIWTTLSVVVGACFHTQVFHLGHRVFSSCK